MLKYKYIMVDLGIFITSRVKRKVVVFFTTYPAIKMHSRGLAKLIKEDPGNLQRELSRLEKEGFLKKEKKKNTFVFYANTDFILFKELQSIVMKVRAQQTSSRNVKLLSHSSDK